MESNRPDSGVARARGWAGSAFGVHSEAPIAAILTIAATGIALRLSQALHHDAAWLLVATGRMLDGAAIYVDDVIEVNPPLILALYAPAVLAGRWLGVSEILAFHASVWVLCAGSLWLCNAALRRALPERRSLRLYTLAVLAYLAFVFVDRNLGQREHLLWLLLVPYLLATAARAGGRPVATGTAILAGLGGGLAVCVKPHYLLLAAAVEATLALRRRSFRAIFRPEAWCAGGVGLAYGAAILSWTPAYLESIVPMARDAYWAYSPEFSTIVRGADLALLGSLALPLFWLRRDERQGDLARVLAVAAASAYGVMLVQGTGWVYHRLPFQCAAILLWGVASLDALGRLGRGAAPSPAAPTRIVAAALAVLVSVALLTLQPGLVRTLRTGSEWRAGRPVGYTERLRAVIDRFAGDGSVYFVSPEMAPPFPAVSYSRASWASRFPCLWPAAPILRARRGDPRAPARLTPERTAAFERYFLDAVIDDLERHRPELILTDLRENHVAYGGYPIDLLAYLRSDPRFEAIWSRYEVLPGRVGPFAVAVRRGPD